MFFNPEDGRVGCSEWGAALCFTVFNDAFPCYLAAWGLPAVNTPNLRADLTRWCPHLTEGPTRWCPHLTEGITRWCPHPPH